METLFSLEGDSSVLHVASCTAHIMTRNWHQNIMAAFFAGKLAREKNGRFGKACLGKRGRNLWEGSKRKLSKVLKLLKVQKHPS